MRAECRFYDLYCPAKELRFALPRIASHRIALYGIATSNAAYE